VFILYFSLLAHLLVGAGSVEGVVLCFEANGQVAVEYSRNGNCCSSLTPQASSRSSSLVENLLDSDNCGTCLDVPILFGRNGRPFTKAQNLLPHLEPVFVLISLFPVISLTETVNEGSYLQLLPPPNSTLALHRTTLLLI